MHLRGSYSTAQASTNYELCTRAYAVPNSIFLSILALCYEENVLFTCIIFYNRYSGP